MWIMAVIARTGATTAPKKLKAKERADLLDILGSDTVSQDGNVKKKIEAEKIDAEKAELEAVFGEGFTIKELREIKQIYDDYSNNYVLKTAMHKRALVKVCKCTMKYNKALAGEDLEAIKIWDSALSKALKEAKINPEQLSASDTNDGLSCFSVASLWVERAKGPTNLIEILPETLSTPQDCPDYTIWQLVNHIKALRGEKLIEYHETYSFMKRMYDEHKERFAKIIKEPVDLEEEGLDEDLFTVD